MKRQWKKAAICLSTALVLGSVWGCSKGGSSAPSTETTKADSKESASTSSEPITLSAIIKDMSADDPVSVKFLETVSKQVSQEMGKEVKIELVPISEGTYSESVGLLLQSGEIPDLIYFQGGDYQFAITQQILEDLRPYIESSTNIKSMMQPFNEERIENYPYILWLSPDRIKVPVVRKDWLDASKTGAALLNDPTVENYKAFLSELKAAHNLKAAITIPGDLTELNTIFNLAFGVEQTWVKQGDSYVYSKVSDAEKEKLSFYADLYREGLLDNEWLTMKWDTKESSFYNGQVGVVCGTQGSVTNIYNSKMTTQNGEQAELVVLPPAKGKASGYLPGDISKESRGWAISAFSDQEHKDAAFAVLEYMASPDGQILDKLGYEGEHYEIKDGTYILTDKISEWWPRFHESTIGLEANISKEKPYFSPAAMSSLDMASQYASFDNAFVMPDDYITNWDAGEALCAEFAADIISGKKTVADFDAFKEAWNNLGGAEITTYANETIQ